MARPRPPLVFVEVARARRQHPVLFALGVLAFGLAIAGLWWTVFSPLFDDPRDWVQRERAFRRIVHEVLTGQEREAPPAPELPPWPPPLDDAREALVQCADAQVARGVRFSGGYHPLAYPWGDVPEHLATSADLVVRCLREIDLDVQEMLHVDRVDHPRRYPLQLWADKRPDPSIDHRRLANLLAFLQAFAEALPVAVDTAEKRAGFAPGDVVFWTSAGGGEQPTLVGLVLDRRDGEGVPHVATLVPGERVASDRHRLTDWPVTGHFRVARDRVLERFLEENPRARLTPRPPPAPRPAH